MNYRVKSIDHELSEFAALRQRSSTASLSMMIDIVKLDVVTYKGEGTYHRLAINRWLREVDIAIQAPAFD